MLLYIIINKKTISPSHRGINFPLKMTSLLGIDVLIGTIFPSKLDEVGYGAHRFLFMVALMLFCASPFFTGLFI